MNRYAVRIGSAVALVALAVCASTPARCAERAAFTFQGRQIVFTQTISQSGGRAVSIDDPGLHALFDRIGATVTWQPGERYVLVTTAEPVVISFAIGDTRYDVGPVTQTASFAPFMLDGHAFVPLNELLRALDFAVVASGSQQVLQPQLASVDLQSTGRGSKLVAHGGMPLDARIISDAAGKLVIAFDGVGSTLDRTRNFSSSAVRRMDVRTEGPAAKPKTYVTLYLAPGATHTAVGSDDQRDFTIGFDGAPSGQPVAAAPQAPAANAPETAETPGPTLVTPAPPAATVLPSPAGGPVQVTAVQAQSQNGSFVVQIAVNGDATYEWHRLRPPDNRFWLDVHNARLAIPPSDQNASAPVTAVRVHQQSPDTVRVALSLADFDVLNVVPSATGVTVTVANQIADDSVAHAGTGTLGQTAVAAAQPPASPGPWKFAPQPSPNTYVAANPRLIVLDPGHGGSDPGSYRGDAVEKALTLDISKRLRDILVARGWQVVMTHEDDRDVFAPNDSAHDELQARDDVANSRGARLFLSVHVNAFINSGPHGATVYYYKPVDLALARAVDRRIAGQAGIKDDGVIKDKLYVVHHANMPAALVETAFISNPDDRALLQSPEWRQKMAQAIADGIADYAGAPPPATAANGQ